MSARSQAGVPSPSFDCTPNGTAIEHAICGDPKLAAEDQLMARLYSLASASAFGRGPSSQPAAQREWLKSRDETCSKSQDAAVCLMSSYAERNEQLALAVLFSRPDIALPELRRLDPKAAPMFEAIYLYARSPRPADSDRLHIAGLLQPFAAQEDGSRWGEVAPNDAVKNDDDFAEFIGIRSAFLRDDVYGRAFPCAAMVRKPDLADATGPRFGSTMDNFVMQSDCEDTLPPLPKFTALVEKRLNGMSDCGGGTIRFAYYRAFTNAALAARLATASGRYKGRVKPFPRRRNVTRADIGAALDELAAYYVRYGRSDAGRSRPLARQMIYEMLEQAWQC